MVHVNEERIPKTYHLVGVSFRNRIVVFGGVSKESYTTYVLSEEGELVQDFSLEGNIPGEMCRGSMRVKRGRIYAVGLNKAGYDYKYSLRVFNGNGWSLT